MDNNAPPSHDWRISSNVSLTINDNLGALFHRPRRFFDNPRELFDSLREIFDNPPRSSDNLRKIFDNPPRSFGNTREFFDDPPRSFDNRNRLFDRLREIFDNPFRSSDNLPRLFDKPCGLFDGLRESIDMLHRLFDKLQQLFDKLIGMFDRLIGLYDRSIRLFHKWRRLSEKLRWSFNMLHALSHNVISSIHNSRHPAPEPVEMSGNFISRFSGLIGRVCALICRRSSGRVIRSDPIFYLTSDNPRIVQRGAGLFLRGFVDISPDCTIIDTMEEIIVSKNGVPIRLPDERWIHIVENHDDLAGYMDDVLGVVENPDFIIEGYGEALIALRQIRENKFLAVVYKEIEKVDGFIITAYFSSKIKLEREVILWKRKESKKEI